MPSTAPPADAPPPAPAPSEADIAAFQAQAALSMAFLRNLVGRHVAGYTPPTADELADNSCVVPGLGLPC